MGWGREREREHGTKEKQIIKGAAVAEAATEGLPIRAGRAPLLPLPPRPLLLLLLRRGAAPAESP